MKTDFALLTILFLFKSIFPNFIVYPNDTINVGEEVIFSAETLITDEIFTKGAYNTFVWDFGDSSMTADIRFRTGATISHYFMKPGVFKVILTLTNPDSSKKEYFHDIHVTGEKAIDSFEVWHAPFHARLAQYVYVQIPQKIYSDASNYLKVTLEKKNDISKTLLEKNGLKKEEIFLLEQRKLIPGDYLLRVRLINSTGSKISEIVEKFTVTEPVENGVYINEHNALIKNNKHYFPVSAWMLDESKMPDWESGGYINSVFMTGYLQNDNADEWHRYVTTSCRYHNFDVLGTEHWPGKAKVNRNSRVSSFLEYLYKVNKEPNFIAYCWDDEPNIGGWTGNILPSVYEAWSYITNKADPHHPSLTNLAGFVYLPLKNGTSEKEFNFMYSSRFNGGKKAHIADIYHGACFALERYRNLSSIFADTTIRAIDAYTYYLKNRNDLNYNLVPTMSVSATCNILPDNPLYNGAPTPSQMRMIGWLNIIYGSKGMNWYQYQDTTPPENFGFMAEYRDQIDDLKDVILSQEDTTVKVTDNANSKGNRVDVMTKKFGNRVYIFAVRVTELDYMDDPSLEPESIKVNFTIKGITTDGKKLIEYKRFRRYADFFDISNDDTTLELSLKRNNLEPGKIIFAGRSSITGDWHYMFGNNDGKVFKNGYWKNKNKFIAGDIDYSNGKFKIAFKKENDGNNFALKKGANNLRVMYATKPEEIKLQLSGNKFEDYFSREDVHIYVLGDQNDNLTSKDTRSKPVLNSNPIRKGKCFYFSNPKSTIMLCNLKGDVLDRRFIKNKYYNLNNKLASGTYILIENTYNGNTNKLRFILTN
jgi:hypothetical protein